MSRELVPLWDGLGVLLSVAAFAWALNAGSRPTAGQRFVLMAVCAALLTMFIARLLLCF